MFWIHDNHPMLGIHFKQSPWAETVRWGDGYIGPGWHHHQEWSSGIGKKPFKHRVMWIGSCNWIKSKASCWKWAWIGRIQQLKMLGNWQNIQTALTEEGREIHVNQCKTKVTASSCSLLQGQWVVLTTASWWQRRADQTGPASNTQWAECGCCLVGIV